MQLTFMQKQTRLRKAGTPVDDFDILIGTTAVTHNLILVTNNTSHFKSIKGINLEDWTKA
jgi:tRNA(fMet)-specific endonuclease VapC